ncbi:MAG: OmpH family outer membrane protein [Bacteroidales bacterium]|nr:OmpH family outer membrane protein [Bacteroidales bacterium]
MKNQLLVISLILMLLPTQIIAQKFKYGYINADKILAEMPEIEKANKDLEGYIKQINDYINSKNDEYKSKLADFSKNEGNYSELIKTDKQNELNKMANDIKQFQIDAQNDINKKKQELYQSAIVKLKAAINQVAKEGGYRFILDNSNGQLLYAEQGDDVALLVRKKLGIIN